MDLLKALRPQQWFKNILLLLPLLLAHQYTDVMQLQKIINAFILFSLVASSIYLINDCFDITADKLHPVKKYRSIASGKISITYALIVASILSLVSFYLAGYISYKFQIILLSYFLISFLYSYFLKKVVLIDVFVLAFLYTLRIITGTIVIDVEISFWLLGFSIFFFLSLALVKRVSELLTLKNSNKLSIEGRGYHINDILLLTIKGVVAGFISIVIMALYINSNVAIQSYQNPQIIWFVIPILLYWVSFIWLITVRDEMNEDPVYFAITNKQSWLIFICVIFLILIAK
jgi:4-hydroxybenzoate polyprenyltransferase